MRAGVLVIVLCAVLASAGATVPDPASGKGRAKVTAAIPPVATTGDVIRVRGRLARARRAVLQQRVRGRWVARTRGRGKRFALRWRAPRRRGVVTLRVAAVRRGRTVAASRARRVAVSAIEVLKPSRVLEAPAPGVPGALRYDGAASATSGEYVALDVGPATPQGMLARVVSTRTENGDTVVETVPASIVEAIPEGSIDDADVSGAGAHAAASPQSFLSAFSCSADVTAALEGSLDVTIDPEFELRWRRLKVSHAKAVATIRGDADVKAGISGRGSCELAKTQVATWDAPTFKVMLGVVPVIITPRTALYVSGSAEARAAYETGVHGFVSATAGVRYDGGNVDPIGDFDHGFSHTPPTTRANASIGARVIPSITFLMYGQAGPRFDITTGLQLDAEAAANPWWKLTAPVELSAGIEVPNLRRFSVDQRTVYETSLLLAQAEPDPVGSEPEVAGGGPERASVSWDSDGTDVDLHVWDEEGNHASYRDQQGIPGALLSSDDTDGYGPEFFDEAPERARTFTFGLCYYNDHGFGATDVSVRLTDPDGTRRESTHTLYYSGDYVLLGSSPAGGGYVPPDGWCDTPF